MAKTESIEVELINVEDLQARLHALESKNPRMRKDINKMIAYVLKQARQQVSKDAKMAVPNDPRKAYAAVRHSVYKRIFGGQVNILQRRKNNGKMYVGEKQRTLRPGQRGGNRMKRSDRTNQVDSYYGTDRGFILRFLNAGTVQRTAGTRTHTITANRGAITARNWFGSSSQAAMEKAASDLEALISRAIYEVWGDRAVNADII